MLIDIIAIIVGIVFIGLSVLGLYLIIRDTRRRSGKWGVNSNLFNFCPRCQEPLPRERTATSWRQMLWGGWTCQSCGCEIDKWGREIIEDIKMNDEK
jgi:hypothetical protein